MALDLSYFVYFSLFFFSDVYNWLWDFKVWHINVMKSKVSSLLWSFPFIDLFTLSPKFHTQGTNHLKAIYICHSVLSKECLPCALSSWFGMQALQPHSTITSICLLGWERVMCLSWFLCVFCVWSWGFGLVFCFVTYFFKMCSYVMPLCC